MSLMESVRGATESSTAKLVLIIIAVTFVFWGVGNQGPTSSVVAEVNGERITDTQFQQVLRQEARRRGRNLSNDELSALQEQVLGQLVQRTVALQEADKLGLEISDSEVAWYIRQYEIFRDESGKFSFELYEKHLKRMGLTRSKFQEEIRESLVLQRMAEVAELSVHVTEPEIQTAFVAQNTTYTLDFVRVRESDVADRVEVTDDEIAAMVAGSPDRITAAYKAHYEARYRTPRKATIRTLLLRLDLDGAFEEDLTERLEALKAELDGGADFDALARRWSEDRSAADGGLLPEQSEPDMDPVIAEAIFAAGAGQHTGIVKTSAGLQLLFVESVAEEIVIPEADVRDELARELIVQERAPQMARDLAQSLLDAWKAAGVAPAEQILAEGLTLDNSGAISLDERSIPKLGAAPSLMAAAESAAAGDVLGTVYSVSGDFVIASVTSRSDADLELLDEERSTLVQRLQGQKRASFFSDWLDDLVANSNVVRYL